MSDRDEIAELLSEYAWAMDAGNFEALNEIFAEDSSFVIHIAGADSYGPISPRPEIVDFIGGTVADQQDQRRHVISNQRFESHGSGEAVVTATLTLNVIADGSLGVKATGVYRADLVREEAGWRMRGLEISLDLPF
jgi:3-phenylpropionate/cinnamic acid dioxygenase small subunit